MTESKKKFNYAKLVLLAVVAIVFFFIGVGITASNVKVIEKTVVEQVEVEVEVEKEVPVADANQYLVLAKAEAIDEIVDEYDLDYNSDEISFKKVYDNWSVSFTEDNYTVYFEAKIRYDSDNEDDRETVLYGFEVTYDYDDKEFEVEVIELEE